MAYRRSTTFGPKQANLTQRHLGDGCRLPFPWTNVGEHAGSAFWGFGMAADSAEPVHGHGEPVMPFRRQQCRDLVFDLRRIVAADKAQSSHYSSEVGVNDDRRTAVDTAENAVGGLASYSGQGGEILHRIGNDPFVAGLQGGGASDDVLRLGIVVSGAFDDRLHVIDRSFCKGMGIGIR